MVVMRTFLLPASLLLLAPASRADDLPPAGITRGEAAIELTVGGELAALYWHGEHVPDNSGGEKRPLAKPFFLPVNAPGGVPVTRAWPVRWPLPEFPPGTTTDHVHQKSVWFCHGDVIPEGVELKVRSSDRRVKGVDFWSESAGHGRIVCTGVGAVKQVSRTHALIPTTNEWRAPDGTKILDETRTIHLVSLPAGRLIVLEIDLHASVCPISFGDTKEGSMGVRVHDAIRLNGPGSDGVVTSSTGEAVKAPAKDNLPVWGKPADWHDYSGTIDGQPAGIAVFDDPRNPHRASWHTRAYGLMAANPFGRADSFPSQKGKTEPAKLAKGERLKLRYGVYAHTGDAAAGKVAEAFKEFTGMK
jgi:hypothetical protein